jgi:hypothetical protein
MTAPIEAASGASAARVGSTRRRHGIALASLAALLALLRIPSLVEPPQFTDEGTYADVGWALDHGAVLYSTVWDNKPPGVYWLAAMADLIHPSVAVLHVIAAIVAVLGTAGVWLLGVRLAAPLEAWAAGVAFAVVVSLPTLAGDVLNAEGVGALLMICAMVLVTGGAAPSRRPALVAAGIAVGAAVLFKATFLADAVVIVSLPSVSALAAGRRPGRNELRAGALCAGGVAVVVAAAMTVLAIEGSLGGFLDVVLRQDFTYLNWTASGAGAGSAPPPSTGIPLTTLLTVSRVLVILGAGAATTLALARRGNLAATLVTWWLTWDLAAVMLSARGLVQYAQQAEPAVCLAAALVAGVAYRRRSALPVALAATLGAWATCEAALLIPTAEVAPIVHQPFYSFASSVVAPRDITHYLGRGWERVLGQLSTADYEAGFGDEPSQVHDTVGIIQSHSAPGDSVFVWGALPWAYALSARMPAGRYVTLNAAYAVDPGAQDLLLTELMQHSPRVLVALVPLPPAVVAMLRAQRFAEQAPAPGGEVVWLAPGAT